MMGRHLNKEEPAEDEFYTKPVSQYNFNDIMKFAKCLKQKLDSFTKSEKNMQFVRDFFDYLKQ
jgi:hypothetical protein